MDSEKIKEFQELFHTGKMRDFTPEETEAINKWIESQYKSTGINLFDLLNKEDKDSSSKNTGDI